MWDPDTEYALARGTPGPLVRLRRPRTTAPSRPDRTGRVLRREVSLRHGKSGTSSTDPSRRNPASHARRCGLWRIDGGQARPPPGQSAARCVSSRLDGTRRSSPRTEGHDGCPSGGSRSTGPRNRCGSSIRRSATTDRAHRETATRTSPGPQPASAGTDATWPSPSLAIRSSTPTIHRQPSCKRRQLSPWCPSLSTPATLYAPATRSGARSPYALTPPLGARVLVAYRTGCPVPVASGREPGCADTQTADGKSSPGGKDVKKRSSSTRGRPDNGAT